MEEEEASERARERGKWTPSKGAITAAATAATASVGAGGIVGWRRAGPERALIDFFLYTYTYL